MANIASCKKCGSDNSHQHERRTGHGVDEELCCGIHALVVTPLADKEIHRHEHDFKKHEEEKQVKAEEATHNACFKHQHPHQVLLVIVMRINANNDQREQNSREHYKEERNSINA